MSILKDIQSDYRLGGFTEKVIYWNVGVFLLCIPLFYQFASLTFDYPEWIALSANPNVVLRHPWTLLTYAFLHDGFLHIFFNMLVLNFSARLFLTYFTQKQFLGLYLLGAIFSGLVFTSTFFLLGNSGIIVGASGAIMAVLVGVTTYNPLMQIRLLLIGYVKLWHLTAVILLLDVLQIRGGNFGGHIAHLSGAIFGFFFITLLKNGTDLSKFISGIFDFFANLFKPRQKHNFKKVHTNRAPVRQQAPVSPAGKDKTQRQIDEILDKISQSGYDSLSKEEKEFLFRAGK